MDERSRRFKFLAVGAVGTLARYYPDRTSRAVTLDAKEWADVVEEIQDWLADDDADDRGAE